MARRKILALANLDPYSLPYAPRSRGLGVSNNDWMVLYIARFSLESFIRPSDVQAALKRWRSLGGDVIGISAKPFHGYNGCFYGAADDHKHYARYHGCYKDAILWSKPGVIITDAGLEHAKRILETYKAKLRIAQRIQRSIALQKTRLALAA